MSATPGQRRGRNAGAIVVGSADQFGSLVLSKSKEFVKRHPVISVTWVVGLLISMLATGFTPAPEAVEKYEAKIAVLNDSALADAEEDMAYWEELYRRSRGMFWGCDESCMRKKREYETKRTMFNSINRDYQKELAEAKSELGVFSQDGVEETKDLFWRKVAGGKQFAKRATMWDAVFMSFGAYSRRDEGIMAVLVRLAFRILVNLTMGLFKAVLEFLFSIWRKVAGTSRIFMFGSFRRRLACFALYDMAGFFVIIWSYNPDPITTMAFFGMAAIAALSLLATWLLGLAALGVGGVYAVAKVAETAQIEAARQQGQNPRAAQEYIQQQRAYQYQQQQQARRRPTPGYAPSSRPQQPGTSGNTGSNWDHLD